MHNEALTPNAPDPTPSRKVTPARALAVVSPDPARTGGAANDAAQARSARDSQKAETTTNPRETGLASTRARTSALFLTQLIACARRLPAYRGAPPGRTGRGGAGLWCCLGTAPALRTGDLGFLRAYADGAAGGFSARTDRHPRPGPCAEPAGAPHWRRCCCDRGRSHADS